MYLYSFEAMRNGTHGPQEAGSLQERLAFLHQDLGRIANSKIKLYQKLTTLRSQRPVDWRTESQTVDRISMHDKNIAIRRTEICKVESQLKKQ
jgi:hypothetical protein